MVGASNYPLTDDEYEILDYLDHKGEITGNVDEMIDTISAGMKKDRSIVEVGVAYLIKFGFILPKEGGLVVVPPPNTIYVITVEDIIFGPIFSHGGELLERIEFVSNGNTFIGFDRQVEIPLLQSFILKFKAKIPKWQLFEEKRGWWPRYKELKRPVVRVTNMVLHYGGENKVTIPVDHVIDLSDGASDQLTYQIRIMRLEGNE